MSYSYAVVSALKDNYVAVIWNNANEAICVDPSEAPPVQKFLQQKQLKLVGILNTHHHHDHIGGNEDLRQIYDCAIWAPLKNKHEIANADHYVSEGDVIPLLGLKFVTWEVPGHTLGHVAFVCHEQNWVFVGDTLFGLGCGRLFEGTFEQMFASLSRLKSLPDSTLVFCGHEYTEQNLRFTLDKISPKDSDLLQYKDEVLKLRTQNKPTVPFLIGFQKKMNPFLNCGFAEFKERRIMKNNY